MRLWDATTRTCKQTLEGHINAPAFSPDGKVLASTSSDMTVRLWVATTGSCKHALEGHKDSVHAVAVLPDGKALVSASMDDTVHLWDAITGARKQTFNIHTRILLFSGDGRCLKTRGLLSFDSSSLDTYPHQIRGISVNVEWVPQDTEFRIVM